jgi:hypothetical protein
MYFEHLFLQCNCAQINPSSLLLLLAPFALCLGLCAGRPRRGRRLRAPTAAARRRPQQPHRPQGLEGLVLGEARPLAVAAVEQELEGDALDGGGGCGWGRSGEKCDVRAVGRTR